VDAFVAERREFPVHRCGLIRIRQQIDVLSRTNDVMMCQREPTDQCIGRTNSVEASKDFLQLPAKP
jgi:hypothetical protein